MQIVYCDTCGTRIGDDEDVAAANLPDGTIMCAKCRAAAGKPTRVSHSKIVLGASAKRLPTVKPSHGGAATTTTSNRTKRNEAQSKPTGSNNMTIVVVASLLVLGGVVAFFVLKDKDSGAGKTPAPPPPAVVTPKVSSQPASSSESKLSDAEKAAKLQKESEAEFGKVLKFEGLAEDDSEGKASRLQAFISKYPDSIEASRAQSMIREISEPPAAPPPSNLAAPPPVPSASGALPDSLKDGLLAYWNFESVQKGRVVEASAGKLEGSMSGATITTDVPRIAGNKKSFASKGSTSHVKFGADVNCDLTKDVTGTFSICAWVLPKGTRNETPESVEGTAGTGGQRYAIFPVQGGTTYGKGHAGVGLSIGNNGVSVFEHSDAYLASPLVYPVSLTAWTHVAVVYDNHTPCLYLNGQRVKAGKVSTFTVHPSAAVCGDIMYGNYLGKIDEVRIYSRALSETEVQALAGVEK